VDSGQVRDQVPAGYTAVRANQVTSLHPGTARFLADNPEYGSWIPAGMCTFYFEAIQVNGHRYAEKSTDNSEAITWWGIAVAPSGPAVTPAPVYTASLLATSDWHPGKEAEGVFAKVDRVEILAGKIPESLDNRYTIKLDRKTQVLFDGHLTRDSAVVGQAFERTWVNSGSRGSFWQIGLRLQVDSTRLMAGALRVQGKSDFARMLQASPVRTIGPMYLGGGGEITFTR
jgi:hypothetical protein